MHTPTNPLPPAGSMGPIIDSIQAGIVVFDLAGRVVHANAFFCAMVGYRVEELRGQTAPFPYWAAEHVGECMAGLQAALEGRPAPAGIETTFVRKDGKPFEVRVRVQPLLPDAGAAGWVATILDVSETRALLRSNLEAKLRLEDFAQTGSDVRWETDAEDRLVSIEGSHESITGMETAAVLGKTREEIFRIWGADLTAQPWATRLAAIAGRQSYRNVDMNVAMPEGDDVWIRSSAKARFDAAGRFLGYRGVSTDISEQKSSELRTSAAETASGNLIELSTQGMLVMRDRQVVSANPAACQLTGREVADLVGLTARELVHPEDHATITEKHARRLRGETIAPYEIRVLRPDGSAVWTEITVVPLQWQGQPATVSCLYDVTARKQAEEDRRRFRAAIDMSPDIVMLIDPVSMRYVDCNDEATRSLGYSREELLAMGPVEVSNASRDELAVAYRSLITGDNDHTIVTGNWRCKGGSSIPVEVSRRALQTPAGYVVVSVARDIRERLLAEAKLRASEQRFRSLVALSSDWYWEQDAQLRFVHFGPRPNSEETFEADEASIEGKRRWEIEGMTPLSCTWEEHRATLEARRTFRDFVYARIDVDGKLHYVTVSGEPVFDAQGAFAGYRGVARDITAERRVQEHLRQAQKLEAIGQLTGGLAHDFNNLLGIALGNLDEITPRLAPDSEMRERHRTALDALVRASEVTRSLLAVARRQPLEVECYDLNTLLAEMLPLMRVSAGADIAVSEQLAAEPLWAQLDANGLSNVVLNLVINARDALKDVAGNKHLALRTREQAVGEAEPDLAAGRYAVLEVSDNGSGMSKAVSAQAFVPFFTTKERGQGTGLGLAMVRGFAEQLGGTARIDSAPGRGTSVCLYLPLDAARAAPQAQRLEALGRDQTPLDTPAAGAVAADPVHAAPPVPLDEAQDAAARVLVVDDEEALCELACLWLEQLGYRARAAHSAAAALELLEREPFELLFTDMVMPGGMDGMTLAHKALALRPGLRVLITSGYAQRLIDEPNPPGPLLPKPYRKNELERALLALSAPIEG